MDAESDGVEPAAAETSQISGRKSRRGYDYQNARTSAVDDQRLRVNMLKTYQGICCQCMEILLRL
jgi:hypothetical protein